MTRILLLGRDGQVGWELARILPDLGELHARGRQETDMADSDQLRSRVREVGPELIVNAAAYTDVDGAESDLELAMAVNGLAPGILAEEAHRLGALLVHFSTDYVFDGRAREPYNESEAPYPINAYGRSKLAGEQAIQDIDGRHLILRTSWVYSLRRDSFVSKVLRWADRHDTLRVVDDQWGSPTWCRALADATIHALRRILTAPTEAQLGLFHVVCRGAPSRYELAQAVLNESRIEPRPVLEKACSDEFPAPAARPQFSALDPSRFESAFEYRMPGWREALAAAMASGTSPDDPAG